ncbi:hypothetical protein [Candidatus Spongiihabitans sp.]
MIAQKETPLEGQLLASFMREAIRIHFLFLSPLGSYLGGALDDFLLVFD